MPGRVTLLGMLCAGLLGGVAATARAAATEVFVPAGVPATTPNDPLPDARAAAITFSGVNVVQGDVVTITATGTASGGPGFGSFDANGAPAGSQYYSGPVSGGDFPDIAGPPANIYSLVGTIYSPADLSPAGNQWFLVGTSLTMTASSSGQLALLFDDALYRDSWLPAYADNTGGFDVTITVQSPDTTPPAVTVNFPSPSSGLNGWFNGNDVTPVAGSVTAADPSNVSSISCAGATLGNVSGYGTTTAGGGLTVSGDGIHDVTCTATDGAGNSGADVGSANTAAVKIDTTPPYGVSFAGGGLSDGASYYFGSVPAGPASCSAQDDGSGFDHCRAALCAHRRRTKVGHLE